MITSLQNPKIQRVRALLQRRKIRMETQAFVAEGVRLIEEASLTKCKPVLILYSQKLSKRGQRLILHYQAQGIKIEEITSHLMEIISETENSQGILAIFPQDSLPIPSSLNYILIADSLRDPGNLGTLLRSAAAAGAQAVILAPGTTDAFAPKVLRSGMGVHFHLPIHSLTWENISILCKDQKDNVLTIYLADSNQGNPYWNLDLRQPIAIIISNEAEGASPQARQLADGLINIPMPGRGESLNAAIAASILLFEVVRQRNL